MLRAKHEINFSDLTESEMDKLWTVDDYEIDTMHYSVNGFDVTVSNDLLIEALNTLPDRNRDIILLAYFLDMSDAEIAKLLQNNRKTIYRHRMTALDLLTKFMKDIKNDKKQNQ